MHTVLTLLADLFKHESVLREHSCRVAVSAMRFAACLGYSGELQTHLFTAGLFHDVGKLLVPTEILNAERPLTDKEFFLVKMHPVWGENLGRKVGLSELELSIIRGHHERLDGSGYPDGLKSPEISDCLRIMAICDTADAILHRRPYKPAFTAQVCVDELIRSVGKLDEQLIYSFIEYWPKIFSEP